MLRAWQVRQVRLPAGLRTGQRRQPPPQSLQLSSQGGANAAQCRPSTAPTSPRSVNYLALDSTLLNRLVFIRKPRRPWEITARYREWTARLGKQQHRAPQFRAVGLDDGRDPTARCSGRNRQSTRRAVPKSSWCQARTGRLRHGHRRARRGAGQKFPNAVSSCSRTPSRLGGESADSHLLDAITDIARGVISDFRRRCRGATPSPRKSGSATPVSHRLTDPAAREQADRNSGRTAAGRPRPVIRAQDRR